MIVAEVRVLKCCIPMMANGCRFHQGSDLLPAHGSSMIAGIWKVAGSDDQA